jgi:Mn2+/Fe2+ NRAMP family transporter
VTRRRVIRPLRTVDHAGPFGRQSCRGGPARPGQPSPGLPTPGVESAIADESSVSRKFSEARLFLGLFTIEIIVGAGLSLVPGNLISLLVNAQILNGVITPILLALILVLANRVNVLGDAANGRIFRVVATMTVGVVAAMAAGALATELGGI